MNSPRRVMEPRGVEPLCRNALTRASTRVVNSLISDHLRLLTAWDDPMHTKCRGKPHARVSPPVRCFLDDTPSGVKRHPCSLIRLRVRTAYWQTSFCILFTWPVCSTARHQCLESPGRYRYGPVQTNPILSLQCSHLCGANENTFQFFKSDSWAYKSLFGWTLQCCQRAHFAKLMANAMDLQRNRSELSSPHNEREFISPRLRRPRRGIYSTRSTPQLCSTRRMLDS